jgi:hypothetical protein
LCRWCSSFPHSSCMFPSICFWIQLYHISLCDYIWYTDLVQHAFIVMS